MSPEELQMLKDITLNRIRAIEEKALMRLNMTDEEKELFFLYKKMKADPELRELLTTLLIAASKGKNSGIKTSEPDEEKIN